MTKNEKPVLQEVQETADEISETEARLAELRRHRAVLMSKASREGNSWHRIAIEARMTENGARKSVISAGLLDRRA